MRSGDSRIVLRQGGDFHPIRFWLHDLLKRLQALILRFIDGGHRYPIDTPTRTWDALGAVAGPCAQWLVTPGEKSFSSEEST